MSAPIHRLLLRGCAPTPLASYLKALGVLRVIAEQKDPGVRGLWQGERFVLLTTLDRDAVLDFFLRDWAPSPFVSPWNKGSKLAVVDPKGVEPLVDSTAPRFAPVRQAIDQARRINKSFAHAVAEESAIKDEANRIRGKAAKDALRNSEDYKQRLAAASRKCKRLKDRMQAECQRRWRGPALRWLRAAVVIQADDSAVFPALLGTGGSDGKLDFTNNAMQRLGQLFDLKSADGAAQPAAAASLRAALFGTSQQAMSPGAIGQFAPADSGGLNSSAGPLGKSMLNPWDLPLLLEGALLFTAGSSRRLGAAGSARTVAPFSARSWSAGYSSAAQADESARGEQWMPLWSRPWTAAELRALLAEGRCQIGKRPTDNALDVARAVARLGVARGIDTFQRYAYMERNGKSNYAVPIGRWRVQASPSARLLDDLDRFDWWDHIRRAARDEHAPAALARCEHALGDATLAVLAHGEEPGRWQDVLVSLAMLEAQLLQSASFTAKKRLRPIPPLSPAWIQSADDGRPELRLALSLGTATAPMLRGQPRDPVRCHWLPLDRWGGFQTGEQGLTRTPRLVMFGRDPQADLLHLVQRRMIEAESGAGRTLPILARRGLAARQDDIMALLQGRVDIGRTLWLARALAALDPGQRCMAPRRGHGSVDVLDPAWMVLRLCHLPACLPDGISIPVDPAIVRLLASGDSARAFALALPRLRASGIYAPLRVLAFRPATARLLAASLAFPVSPYLAQSLADQLVGNPVPHRAHDAQEHRHVG